MSKKKKNNIKKPVKKEVVEVKDEEKKEVKTEPAKLLSDKTIAILYVVCAVIWLVSGILDFIASEILKGSVSFGIAVVLALLSVVYFRRLKK